MKNAILLGTALILLLPAVALAAGMATLVNKKGETGQVYWQNGVVVFNQPASGKAKGKPERVMLKNDDVYFIFGPGAKPRVIEMSGLVDMFRAMASKAQQDSGGILGKITSVEATGKTETVAGIGGRVYKVTIVQDGESKTYRTVLTDNSTVVKLTEIVIARAISILGDQGGVVERYLSAFPEDSRGVLKLGKRFHFTKVSSANPPDKWFQLPAEPTSFAQAMMMKMAEQMSNSGKSK